MREIGRANPSQIEVAFGVGGELQTSQHLDNSPARIVVGESVDLENRATRTGKRQRTFTVFN
jgi:hypothetical protein